MAREINLVPDIKEEMIKTLKLRNFIFFICIIVASVSAGITVIFGAIAGGQIAVIEGNKTTINTLSDKLNSYTDLKDFLTIRNQLNDISSITDNKKVLSRTFNILSALIPSGPDTITISALNVNLSGESPTFSFDAQANAGKPPYFDYKVLDTFEKSMAYMRYDYGSYVTKDGETIPAYCIIESGDDGSVFRDSSRGYYAFWTIKGEGCNPSNSNPASSTESYNGEEVVRIWRTPQYSQWYPKNMQLDGTISGVEHFQSSCIKYSGDNSANSSNPKWTESNQSCKLVPGEAEGIKVSNSSNGRDSSGELVLRFSAVITLSPQVYGFNNTHMLAIAPTGYHNVTDSYVQIQNMFGAKALDCAEGDASCNTNGGN